MSTSVHNVNVASQDVLATPTVLKAEHPLTDALQATVSDHRQTVWNILDRKDPRLLVVVGPCSIHDPSAALEYAARLNSLAQELQESLFIVMRVYFEKPRTTVGWKGLINDPDLDDSFHIEKGLRIARKLLIDIVEMGLPAATEALDPISPQYLQDLIAWSAIGARTTESQTHREMASGLSSAVGFKNGTDGSLDVAVNALESAARPHRFLGINSQGQVSVFSTRGNRYGHVVLRGGTAGPNYDPVSISLCEKALIAAELPANIMVDCSHANSNKDPSLQPIVADGVADQIVGGNRSVMGLMIESNLSAGKQALGSDLSALQYGVSVTDGCIGWSDTEDCLRALAAKTSLALKARNS
ncbi:MAG: 3-deoxy-7-phosphoheptulonate synthase [Pseudomonadota bacterium]